MADNDNKFAFSPTRRSFMQRAGAAGVRVASGKANKIVGAVKEPLEKNWRGVSDKIAGHHIDIYHHFKELGSDTEGHGPGWFWTKYEKGGLGYGKNHGPFSGPAEAIKHAYNLAKNITDFEE